MRITGGYSLHQSLTIETAAIVKQAVSLARRRGHAQVTPLHVAIAMFSCPTTGLLKRACLQSHSHPLQFKALDLCFNVALNRLPTSASSSPLMAPHSPLPSLSNALVAAFKRAQAHQRRGSIESQQQSVVALKVEIQQLVISVLDDPSVSRVMREAGFSSTQVKNNVEQSVSLEKCNNVVSNQTVQMTTTKTATSLSQFRFPSLGRKASLSEQNDDDVASGVLEAMMNQKTKNTIIVGERGESMVRGVINKLEKKDVPDDMKLVQFISMPLRHIITREEFDGKLAEVRSYVKIRGLVLYLGDVDWISDFWCKYDGDHEQRDYRYYDRLEYTMIKEISRLVVENCTRVWLMGIASFQTYTKCKIGSPSLETLWSLHPLTIPAANLALTLSLENSVKKSEAVDDHKWLLFDQNVEIKKQLDCCSQCSYNFRKEAQHAHAMSTSTSKLPSWLQQYKDENTKQIRVDNREYFDDRITHLCKKWNSICSSSHAKKHDFLGNRLAFNMSTSSTPCSSTSVSSNGLQKPSLSSAFLAAAEKPDLVSNPNSSPNSASSSEDNHYMEEINSVKLNMLCETLEKKVPSQGHIIPEIVSTILKCRSRIVRQASWMFFSGAEEGHDKVTIARELAKAMFGSYDCFTTVGISCFSTTKDHDASTEEEVVSNNRKRARDEHGASLYDRFAEAVSHNPSRVFYVEDADRFDYRSLKGFKKAIRDASVSDCDGGVALMRDAIIIFSCEEFKCGEENGKGLSEEKKCGPLDLNIATNDDDDDDDVNGILDLVDHKVVFKMQV